MVHDGRQIDGRFRLEREIGRGAFGTVFAAIDEQTHQRVAVKIFNPMAEDQDSHDVERFKLEAATVQRIVHPNVVKMIASGATGDATLYLAMELVNGSQLWTWLAHAGKLSVPMVAKVGLAVGSVLVEAHRVGVLHRDIKPENIMLHTTSAGYSPKVLDFGVAKLLGETTGDSLTRTGTVVGTPAYLAPERLEDAENDGRSDVYSLATVLFHSLTGALPYELDPQNFIMSVLRRLDEPPRRISELSNTVPPLIQEAVMRGLTRHPQDRPTAEEFLADFTRAIDASSIAPADDDEAEKKVPRDQGENVGDVAEPTQ